MCENCGCNPTADVRDRILKALDDVRPHLQNDGGDIEFVSVNDDGIVQVRFQGACVGCPHRQMTLQQGVGRYLKEQVPEVKSVELVQ